MNHRSAAIQGSLSTRNGTTSPLPSSSTVVRHNTREHAQLNSGGFMGGGGFNSQSPNMTRSFSNSDFSSFLEGVMTEEERRTRTRYLPDVEGFCTLTKSECKSDLKAARSWEPSNESMQPNADSQDEDHADDMDAGPFVPPAIVSSDDDASQPASSGNAVQGMPPLLESVSSFNPPRPPESSGQNKKRRLTRWDKNPDEIQVDLDNYRKTVQKTREELQLAEAKREKVS